MQGLGPKTSSSWVSRVGPAPRVAGAQLQPEVPGAGRPSPAVLPGRRGRCLPRLGTRDNTVPSAVRWSLWPLQASSAQSDPGQGCGRGGVPQLWTDVNLEGQPGGQVICQRAAGAGSGSLPGPSPP